MSGLTFSQNEKNDNFVREITDSIHSKLLNYFNSDNNVETNNILMQLPIFKDLKVSESEKV